MASSTHETTGFETQTRDICTHPPPPQPGPQTQYIAALLNIPKLFISEVNSFVYYGKLIFNLTEESEFEFESDLWHLASLITLACSALS